MIKYDSFGQRKKGQKWPKVDKLPSKKDRNNPKWTDGTKCGKKFKNQRRKTTFS